MIYTLHIGLSYKCNLKCKHCFVDIDEDKMTVERCLNIIDNLKSEGLFVVVYTYGEPLLWPHFFELVKQVKKRNIVQVLMTNGTVIDKIIAKKIKSSGINKVYVSIDSAREHKHDMNRGMRGAFDKTMRALELLSEIGMKTGIATTVTEDNCNELDDIYKILKKYDLDEISFLRERCNGGVANFPEKLYFVFFKKHIAEVGQKITFHDASLNKIIYEIYNDGYISEEKKDMLIDMNRCKNDYTLCVYPNGEMSKCNFSRKLKCNCFDIDIAEYIRSDEFKNENSICYT